MVDCKASSSSQVAVAVGEDEVEIPELLMEDEDIFRSVLNFESWNDLLTKDEKDRLELLMPKIPSLTPNEVLRPVFSGDDIRFGSNPLSLLWKKLTSGVMIPALRETEVHVNQLLLQQYKLNQANHFIRLLQELLVTRQELLQNALFAGSLEKMVKQCTTGRGKGISTLREANVEQEYKRVLMEIISECGGSDEEIPGNQEDGEVTNSVMSEADYRHILRLHRKQRRKHKISYLNEVEQMSDSMPPRKIHRAAEEGFSPPSAGLSVHRRYPRAEQDVGVTKKDVPSGKRGRKAIKERSQHEGTTAAQAKAIYRIYTPIDNGLVKDAPIEPIVIEGPIPMGKHKCFFSVVKAVFEPLNDKKGELGKLSKTVANMMRNTECSDCSWLNLRSDWVDLTLSALCYLAGEVGAVSSFNPLPHFVPLIDFRDRIDHWKWIGNGRDSELELLVLSDHWLDNMDKTLPVVDYSDYEPPPPHMWTNKVFQRSSPEEVSKFRQMERERYASPHKAYTYGIRGYESPVGPVKGAKVTKKDSISKARGHALLASDRPTCVTILSLVRDATSRLPNGEGTRLDLCLQVQDSQFIADSVSETQLNNAVSGALDRLHYEKDPCVRYDGTRKVWIYLHRGRNEEDFERIYWACEVASKQKKMLTARPRVKPRIILRMDGRDEVLEPGSFADEANKTGKKPMVKSVNSSASAPSIQPLPEGSPSRNVLPPVVTPLLPVPQPGQLSLVVASVVRGGGGGVTDNDPTLKMAKRRAPLLVPGMKDELIDDSQLSQNLKDQKPHRKRKQSLKVAELLRDRIQTHETGSDEKLSFQTSSPSASSGSSWSSDNEDPAGTDALPSNNIADVSMGEIEGNAKDNEWGSSPEATSLDTNFNIGD